MRDIPDPRLDYPATTRNRGPILEVLRRVLPPTGVVLEVASGSGQHAEHFARHLPGLIWQPSDMEAQHRVSIAAWCEGVANVRPPLALDVHQQPWPIAAADAVFCANMIHIAPWSAALALLEGAARVLGRDGGAPLVLYGPFRVGGAHTAPSNEAFDQSLRSRDASWGVRDLDEVTACAAAHGLVHDETIAMPANNLSVVYRAGGGR